MTTPTEATQPLKRARQPKQKEQRREAFLQAALELFIAANGQLPKMADVATRCQLAKGTAYIYFDTKEEMFLTLLEQQQQSWHQKIQREVRRPQQPQASDVWQALQSWETDAPQLWRLAALYQPLLETTLDSKLVLAYRTRSGQLFRQTADKIREALQLPVGQSALPTLMQSYAVMLGLWQQSQLPAALSRVSNASGGQGLTVPLAASGEKIIVPLWQAFIDASAPAPKTKGLGGWFNR